VVRLSVERDIDISFKDRVLDRARRELLKKVPSAARNRSSSRDFER